MALAEQVIREDPCPLQSELITSAYWTPAIWIPLLDRSRQLSVGAPLFIADRTPQMIEQGTSGAIEAVGPLTISSAIYGGSRAFDEFPRLIEDAPAPQDSPHRLVVDPRVESPERDARVGAWVAETAERFDQLLAMPSNWDGHGAPPIKVEHVLAAARFLTAVMDPDTPAPTIVPTAEGGVQLEWHRGGVDVELLFGTEDDDLFVYDLVSEREWEGSAVEGFAEFDLARRLPG